MVKDLSLKHELYRKIFHMLAGVAFVGVSLFIEQTYGLGLLLLAIFAALLVSLVADHLRVERGMRSKLFGFLERARERGRLHATTYAFIGALLAFLMFERDIAYAAIIMFFLGDAAAAMTGRLWGTSKFIGKKSRLGSGTMLVVSAIAGMAVTGSLLLGLSMALVATMVEALSDKMDDSFLIILFAGTAGQLLRFFLGI